MRGRSMSLLAKYPTLALTYKVTLQVKDYTMDSERQDDMKRERLEI